jgi:DNA polymerase I
MPLRRLLLVDGTGVLYRSFFAIRELSTREGRPTNAVFGFIRVMRQLAQHWQPTHWVVAFDGGAPADRLALLPTYKAQRPPMPDGLREQLPLANEYLDRARIAAVRIEKQEADDVLASIARWGEVEGGEVLIATADKDLYQLVSDRIQLIGPADSAAARVGAEQVRAKTGVSPERIVEWLALTGDSVDNIPGVEGLGPKTAAKLLNLYGSLQGIWERLHEVTPERIRERLALARPRVETNLALVRLNDGLACSPGWERMEVRPEDPREVRPFFERLEFGSLVRALDQPTLI